MDNCYFCGQKLDNSNTDKKKFPCIRCKRIVRRRLTERNYYVYLLECKNSAIYTGITTDITRRISEHKNGKGSKYVAKKGVKELLAVWICNDRSEASQLEYKIKQLDHMKKRQLVAQWNDINTKEPIK